MGDAWYDDIALRNGGYRSGAVFERIGRSGEDAFERELIGSLEPGCAALDAGCGDGGFTLIGHSRLLRKGGCMMGIHSAAKDIVMRRLGESGLSGVSIEEYPDSWLGFGDEAEYAKYLAAFPGNPDYLLPENAGRLHESALENAWEGRIRIPEWRFVWKGFKA
jgi:hypothetical protein